MMSLCRTLCLSLLLTFFFVSLQADDAAPEYLPLADARITRVSDAEAFLYRDETSIPLEVDMLVEEGDWIYSMEGTVVLTFSNGSNLVMQRNAVIYLAELRQEPYDYEELGAYGALNADPSRSVTRIFLSEGEVRGHTRSLREDSVFRVSTPVGAAGIRGTRFAVSLRLEGNRLTLNVRNYSGTVILERTFVDSSGQMAADAIDLVDGETLEFNVEVDIDSGEFMADPLDSVVRAIMSEEAVREGNETQEAADNESNTRQEAAPAAPRSTRIDPVMLLSPPPPPPPPPPPAGFTPAAFSPSSAGSAAAGSESASPAAVMAPNPLPPSLTPPAPPFTAPSSAAASPSASAPDRPGPPSEVPAGPPEEITIPDFENPSPMSNRPSSPPGLDRAPGLNR